MKKLDTDKKVEIILSILKRQDNMLTKCNTGKEYERARAYFQRQINYVVQNL